MKYHVTYRLIHPQSLPALSVAVMEASSYAETRCTGNQDQDEMASKRVQGSDYACEATETSKDETSFLTDGECRS